MKTPWSKTHVGYKATVNGDHIAIIAKSRAALRRLHNILMPPGIPFSPKKCHPAQFRRVK